MPGDEVRFRCAMCGRAYAVTEPVWRCRCGAALEIERRAPPALEPAALAGRPFDMWRYAETLPPLTGRVSLGERATPLVALEHGGRPVGLKCDYLLPTGSYKDRGSAILVSHLRDLGVARAVEDSSGNAGASLAAYAARGGLELTVFCPASASPGKLAQVRLYGGRLRLVDGPRARTTEMLERHLAETGDFYASHLWHPYFVEGVKTLAYEIAEQEGWRAPDAVLCPVGAGSILLGLFQGFAELVAAKMLDRMPRLYAVQAARVSPVHRAFEAGAADVAPAENPQPTLAEGIALPRPVRGRRVLEAVRISGGGTAVVSEAEIGAAVRTLGRAGFCVEPTSAVVLPGLDRLTAAGRIEPSERVVLVLSGFGLKAGAALHDLAG